MKKKGFTLIELLAVIVVLAIIALIATPIVMNTIKNAKKGAAERSADSYIDAVETTVATSKLDSDGIPDGTYTINEDGNLTGNGLKEPLEIEMNGNKPTSGTITIKNGQVTKDSTMTIGGYDVKYNEDNKKYEATEKGNISSTVVYRGSAGTIRIGETIDPSDTAKYTKDPSTLGKNYYLKHVLDKDNKVTESYACAIFNSKEYCLRGGDSSFYGYAEDKNNYTGNALLLKQIEDAKIAGISCYFSADDSDCDDGSVHLYARLNGNVLAGDADGYCNVDYDGMLSCTSY